MWENLKNPYRAKSLFNKLHLEKKKQFTILEEGVTIMKHLYMFNGILHSIQRIEEDDKAAF